MASSEYDFLVVGATGQVGVVLTRYLREQGTVFAWKRAEHGDILDAKFLPKARVIVNAAAYTGLLGPEKRYYQSNVLVPVKLALHAAITGSDFHHLSSIAVLSPNTYGYRNSKATAESILERLLNLNNLHVYRIGDVVPDKAEDFRDDHWLSMMFQDNQFDMFERKYEVYFALVSDIAKAIHLLMPYPGIHTPCGRTYRIADFHSMVEVSDRDKHRLYERMMRPYPSLASLTDNTRTEELLSSLHFKWTKLTESYWRGYAKLALKGKGNER